MDPAAMDPVAIILEAVRSGRQRSGAHGRAVHPYRRWRKVVAGNREELTLPSECTETVSSEFAQISEDSAKSCLDSPLKLQLHPLHLWEGAGPTLGAVDPGRSGSSSGGGGFVGLLISDGGWEIGGACKGGDGCDLCGWRSRVVRWGGILGTC